MAIIDWSWWRVLLPLWVFLGHNAAYLLIGFICLFFARSRYGEEQEEEEQSIDETNLLRSYNLASMLFVLIFVDNLLRWNGRRRFELVLALLGEVRDPGIVWSSQPGCPVFVLVRDSSWS
jgi:hypothetical protein